jgi:hypothetical protein
MTAKSNPAASAMASRAMFSRAIVTTWNGEASRRDAQVELVPCLSASMSSTRPQHQETPAMTQSVNVEYQRHGSAAIALRRLAHPGRNGGVVVGDDPVSEPINPDRGGGAVGEIHPR